MQSKKISSTSSLTSTLSEEISISVKNISKIYKLYKSPKDRLKEALNPLRKKYHKPFYALKNVSFDVKKGEILGIVGKNGAGKSTLLEIITGVLSPASGTVKTNGKISALLSLGIGFNPELTGIENIHFNGALQGYSKKELDKKVIDILDFAEIGDFAYQPIKTYSSGMQARLGFAVSINVDPEILIVDEALAVGDELFRRKCYARLEQIMNAGKTILFVTHSIPTITQLCTRAILIDKGELLLEGSPKLVTSLYQKYLFAKNIDKAKIRNEISFKKKGNDHSIEENKLIEIRKGIKPDIKHKNIKNKNLEIYNDQTSFFIPNFKPKSTIEYKNDDVEIFDISIKTLAGNEVNALVTNEDYYFSYKVKFNVKKKNVFFTMSFLTEKGFFIGGAKYPVEDQLLQIDKIGEIFHINWKFKCALLAGNYFCNVGVRNMNEKGKTFLNRIVDSYVFKVQNHKDSCFVGVVNFSQIAIITKES